jgi:hypothetical protein
MKRSLLVWMIVVAASVGSLGHKKTSLAIYITALVMLKVKSK